MLYTNRVSLNLVYIYIVPADYKIFLFQLKFLEQKMEVIKRQNINFYKEMFSTILFNY